MRVDKLIYTRYLVPGIDYIIPGTSMSQRVRKTSISRWHEPAFAFDLISIRKSDTNEHTDTNAELVERSISPCATGLFLLIHSHQSKQTGGGGFAFSLVWNCTSPKVFFLPLYVRLRNRDVGSTYIYSFLFSWLRYSINSDLATQARH